MKSARALMLLLLICGCSRKQPSEAKARLSDNPPPAVKPEEQEIKGATPEDPGPTATVVVPLDVLKKQAKLPQANSEAESQQEPLPIDHPVHIEPQDPKHFLRKTFSVSNHTQFTFLVPPRQG